MGLPPGFDWIWVMDDDVEAMPGAFATLLKYQTLSGFIHLAGSTTKENQFHGKVSSTPPAGTRSRLPS